MTVTTFAGCGSRTTHHLLAAAAAALPLALELGDIPRLHAPSNSSVQFSCPERARWMLRWAWSASESGNLHSSRKPSTQECLELENYCAVVVVAEAGVEISHQMISVAERGYIGLRRSF